MITKTVASATSRGSSLLALFPFVVAQPVLHPLARNDPDLRDPAVRARHRGRLHRARCRSATRRCSASARIRPACCFSSWACRTSWSWLIASILVTAMFGAILALPALRVTGPYLAMVTLAFGTIIQILINEMTFLTDGPMGIKLPKPSLFGHKLNELRISSELVAVLLVLSLIVVHRILRSHLGRAFEALRDSPVASRLHGRLGVSLQGLRVRHQRRLSPVWPAACTPIPKQYISPNTYNFELTILFLLAVIMGGRKTRTGALLGALIIVMLPKPARRHRAVPHMSRRAARCWCVIRHRACCVKRQHRRWREVLVPVAAVIGMAAFSFVLQNIDRLAPDHLRPDDAVRRLLPAGRHRRLRAQARLNLAAPCRRRCERRVRRPSAADDAGRRRPTRVRRRATCSRRAAC